MVVKFASLCPKCGSHLVLQDGQFGEFMACPRFPECKFTRSLHAIEETCEPPPPYCEKCNHTGLLPFIKNNKVIPHVFLNCDCKEEDEHYYPVTPEDIDFPVSYDYHRELCQYYGWTDPGAHLTKELPDEEPTPDLSHQVYYKPDWLPKDIWGLRKEIERFEGRTKYLQKKVDDLLERNLDKKKKHIKYS